MLGKFEIPMLSSTSLDPNVGLSFFMAKGEIEDTIDKCCFMEFVIPPNFPALSIVTLSSRNEWEVVLPMKIDSGVPEYLVTKVRYEIVEADMVMKMASDSQITPEVAKQTRIERNLPLTKTFKVRIVTLEPIHPAYLYHHLY